jgi:hypothetical protein
MPKRRRRNTVGSIARKALSAAKSATLGGLGVVAAFSILPANAAQADGDFRWATANNYGNGYLFLEILNSRTDNTAQVIAYPSNSGSANQWWRDFHISNGYYRLMNHNSGKVLDRWDNHTGPGSDGGCSTPMQYGWVNQYQQYWAYREEYSNAYGRWFTKWVNRLGCSGDAYHDTLSVNFATAAGSGLWTTLFHSNRCVYGDSSAVYHRCYWRRNGQ